jgi:hypothetical protein
MRIRLLSLVLLFAAAPLAAQNCKKGIPCGRTCIAATKTCRIGTPSTSTEPDQRRPVAAQSSGNREVAVEPYTYWQIRSADSVPARAPDWLREDRLFYGRELRPKVQGEPPRVELFPGKQVEEGKGIVIEMRFLKGFRGPT